MLVQRISNLVEVFFDTDKIGVKALLQDRVDSTVFDPAMDLPDHKIDLLIGFPVPFAFQPFEMQLKAADRIKDGPWEIRAEDDLFDHIPRIESATICFQVKLVS